MTGISGAALSAHQTARSRGAADERPLSVLIGLEGLALGGCPINALDLARTLQQRGHRVTIFAINEQVKVSVLPYAASRGFSPILLPPGAGIARRSEDIRALASSVDADITHVFGPWLGPAATIAMARRRSGAAVVTNWMMENVFYTPRHTPVIVGTQGLCEELATRHRGPVYLMEPPVDLTADAPDPSRGRDFRRAWDVQDDELAVVVVGRVDLHLKAEGLAHAIRAIELSGDPSLRLIIVGDGDAFDATRAVAEQVNARLGRPAVLMTGALEDPRPAYDAADIALGMGGSALRALAHGKPLIVLGAGGFARTFQPSGLEHFYRVGFYGEQPVQDPPRHLASLIRELGTEERRQTLGQFGLTEVRRRFGLEAQAVKLEGIYRATLAGLPGGLRRRVLSQGRLARSVVRERLDAVRGAS